LIGEASAAETLWSDALLACDIVATDGVALGGIVVRARAGPVRDRWLEELRAVLPAAISVHRLPGHIDEERLLGGLDLAATLHAGRSVATAGLLAQADGGLLQIGSADRLSVPAAAHVAAAIDTHCVVLERDGLAGRTPTRFGVVALDEGIDADEGVPAVLRERLALAIDLDGVPLAAASASSRRSASVEDARSLEPSVMIDDGRLSAICGIAASLGVDSLRAAWAATRVARICAALHGRGSVDDDDVARAVRLVLVPRATQWPAPAEAPAEAPSESAESPPEQARGANDDGGQLAAADAQSPQDVVLSAVEASLPAGLLDSLRTRSPGSRSIRAAGRKGAQVASRRRGRPAGSRPGRPGRGARLDIVATLRAAAPWQRLRRALAPVPGRLVEVRSGDLRIIRFRQRTQTTTLFVVDASGSTALQRLGEAKGAVELLLAECYVRRDRVALIAFRGARGELLLAPTRSLSRARRSLAALPGGGGTPLASGLDVARQVVESIARQGDSVSVVVLTDGRGNVARDGRADRDAAQRDATDAARALGSLAVRSVVIDTSPRAQPLAQRLAADLGARYVPLPNGRADAIARALRL
jgi:magnesium chelatase subunit D